MSQDPNDLTKQIAWLKDRLPQGPRAVKIPFAHVIEFDWFRTFTFWERVKIFFGYNLEVAIRVPTRHKPGEVGVLVMGETSKADSAVGLMRERAKEALKEMYGVLPSLTQPAPDQNPTTEKPPSPKEAGAT